MNKDAIEMFDELDSRRYIKQDEIEIGENILDFLRNIHEQESTPESCDVDALFEIINRSK